MLMNNLLEDNNAIKFVSYSGKYPNLCSGILILMCGEREYSFGYPTHINEHRKYYKPFWESGGSCGFTNNRSNSYCHTGEWRIDASKLPTELQKYSIEIDRVFNENVEFGCCGGCL